MQSSGELLHTLFYHDLVDTFESEEVYFSGGCRSSWSFGIPSFHQAGRVPVTTSQKQTVGEQHSWRILRNKLCVLVQLLKKNVTIYHGCNSQQYYDILSKITIVAIVLVNHVTSNIARTQSLVMTPRPRVRYSVSLISLARRRRQPHWQPAA